MPNRKKVVPLRQPHPEILESTRLSADNTLVYRVRKYRERNNFEFEALNDDAAKKELADHLGISYPISKKEFSATDAYGMWLIRPCWRKVYPAE